jgi:cardiolipin synthase
MVYIWTGGKMSDQVLEHLDTKLKQGIPVRIIIDAYGSKTNQPTEQFKVFKDLGGKISTFHSFTIAPWDFTKNEVRNHRRAIVIDGNIGYTGGMTISDPWLGNAGSPKEYRDMMFRTTGPMVHDIQGMFSELWTSMTGELLVGDAFYPKITPAQQKNALVYIPLASVPSPDSLVMQKFVLLSLLGAQQKIYITTPYFLPDASFRTALINKAKAGVDVRILVPNEHNDTPSLRFASRYWYEELLQAGVKIYEYQPTFIHSKSIIIDGGWSIIGSANMDNRSRKLNDEDIFGISDKTFGQALENIFLQDLTQAKQIDLTEWGKRSVWERIRELFDQKFVQQY